MYSSYVLWILYSLLLSNTHQVFGCNDHIETQDESTSIAVVLMIFCAMLPVLCVLVFKFTKNDRTKRAVLNSVPPAIISEAVAIERNVPRNSSDLRPFSSIKPHVHYSIRSTTKQRTMKDLMDKARETERFSILPEFNGLTRHSISIRYITGGDWILWSSYDGLWILRLSPTTILRYFPSHEYHSNMGWSS